MLFESLRYMLPFLIRGRSFKGRVFILIYQTIHSIVIEEALEAIGHGIFSRSARKAPNYMMKVVLAIFVKMLVV